jgi:hypothetical protein
MPRYVVTTRRTKRSNAASARDATSGQPGVRLVEAEDPDMVTIEASELAAKELTAKLRDTHIVEPEIRRSLD